jgi:hypothetical protein
VLRDRTSLICLAACFLVVGCAVEDSQSHGEDADWQLGDRESDATDATADVVHDVPNSSDIVVVDASQDSGADARDVNSEDADVAVDASDGDADTGPFELTEATAYFPTAFASSYHSCVLGDDGQVNCFGMGSDPTRQEGTPDYDQAVDVDGEFVQITGGSWHTCGLRRDGSLKCWGGGSEPRSDNPYQGNYEQALDRDGPFLGVSANGFRTCVLDTQQGVECWGNTTAQSDFVGTFAHVSPGWFHTCAIRTDGTLFCTGIGEDPDSDFHNLDFDQAVPPDGRFAQVSSGGYHTCALRLDGTAECWGLGSDPNANEGEEDFDQATPPAGQFEWISAGGFDTCGIRPDGEIECWGYGAGLGPEEPTNMGQADPPDGPFIEVSVGWLHVCGLRPDRSVECWGWNGLGQLDPDGEYAANGCERVDFVDYAFFECSPLCQTGCQADEACRLEQDDDGYWMTLCRPAGADEVGHACTPNSCKPGLLCADEVCRRVCRRYSWGSASCSAQYECTGAETIGVCEPTD